MRALPMLAERRGALEKCVFCPKLCRSACPVSNAEPRETLTPWGKMSLAWMAAHGDVPADRSHASPAWACTDCFACRELCDHENPVAEVLFDARAALVRARAAPENALRAIERFAEHDRETRAAVRRLAQSAPAAIRREREDGGVAVLVGCGYLRSAPDVARDAVEAAAAISGQPVALVEGCCGLPLRLAGDAGRFVEHARSVARSLTRHVRVVTADAGCAYTLRRRYGEVGVELRPPVETLVELASRHPWALAAVDAIEPTPRVRWHDPCQLGRGLGVFDAPRAVLARILGRPPDEFVASREHAACSGAGGLLPSTMPGVARSIARARIESHMQSGGGHVVTACASSLIGLRKAVARDSSAVVEDLASWIARAVKNRGRHTV
jgi:Fe-S oxidoreductase